MLRRRRQKPKTLPDTIPLRKVKRLKLAELMEKYQLTPSAVAKAIKVSHNTIRSYMLDEGREPSYTLIMNLKTYFGLERDEDLIEFEDVES